LFLEINKINIMNNKNLIIGGVVVAGLVAYYLYNKNKSNGGGISAPTGTASNNVENARAPIGSVPYHEAISYVPAPKPRTEEIVTASVPDARPIDIVVNPTISKYANKLIKDATTGKIFFVSKNGYLLEPSELKDTTVKKLTFKNDVIEREASKNVVSADNMKFFKQFGLALLMSPKLKVEKFDAINDFALLYKKFPDFDKSQYAVREATFNTSIAYDEGSRTSNRFTA
jgi:hypothetical protein